MSCVLTPFKTNIFLFKNSENFFFCPSHPTPIYWFEKFDRSKPLMYLVTISLRDKKIPYDLREVISFWNELCIWSTFDSMRRNYFFNIPPPTSPVINRDKGEGKGGSCRWVLHEVPWFNLILITKSGWGLKCLPYDSGSTWLTEQVLVSRLIPFQSWHEVQMKGVRSLKR